MKLSQMTTEQAADVLVKIADPVARILSDDGAMKIISDTIETGTENPMKGYAAILTKLVPFCLKDHRADLFSVIAALDGKTGDEIAKFNFVSTLRVLKDSADKELFDFFRSIAGANTEDEGK